MNDEIWVLDASAFVKLVRPESESAALVAWVQNRRVTSSALLRTEARRAFADHDGKTRRLCDRRLADMHLISLSDAILDAAGRIPGRQLRSLDAIYIASALELGDDLAGLVSYDRRQVMAAQAAGIATASPGAPSAV